METLVKLSAKSFTEKINKELTILPEALRSIIQVSVNDTEYTEVVCVKEYFNFQWKDKVKFMETINPIEPLLSRMCEYECEYEIPPFSATVDIKMKDLFQMKDVIVYNEGEWALPYEDHTWILYKFFEFIEFDQKDVLFRAKSNIKLQQRNIDFIKAFENL